MPPSDFKNRDDIMEGVREWSANQGYAVVIARSRFNRIWLKCDRGGNYENRRNITPDQRKRKRGESRLVGCPFKIVASIRKDGTWHLETENQEHNHEPSGDLSVHPTFRRMTEDQLRKVHEDLENGNTPAETLEDLRKIWPDIKVLTRDVYNARKKYKTMKEQAAIDAGLPPPTPVQDPNGIIPGPSTRGRWAWVPDGEEVTNKKGRRRRRTLPAPEAPVDPQLNTPNRPIQNDESLSTGDQHLMNQLASFSAPHMSSQNDPPASHTNWSETARINTNGFNPSPSRLRSQAQHQQQQQNHATLLEQVSNLANARPTPATDDQQRDTNTNAYNQSPSRLRSQPSTQQQPQPQHHANPLDPIAAHNRTQQSADEGGQSAEDIAARFARLEKENRDQKEMLAAIWKAVSGSGSGSGSGNGNGQGGGSATGGS